MNMNFYTRITYNDMDKWNIIFKILAISESSLK